MQTKPLYLEDAYKTTCTAKILEIKDGAIVLDQTIFYPEGGGQPSDQGTIITSNGKFRVDHVQLLGDKIIHEGKSTGELKVGDEVECKIDWERRYRNMQIHTAGHVLHEAVKSLIPTCNPLRADHGKHAYFVYEGKLSKTLESKIMAKANEIINKDLKINTEFVSLEELQQRASWLPPHLPTNKPLRIMWIDDYEPIPDGGTQVNKTSEISRFSEITIENDGINSKIYYKLEFAIDKKQKETLLASKTNFDVSRLQNLRTEGLAQIISAQDPGEIDRLKIHYLGKNGQLAQLGKQLPKLDKEERIKIGQVFNEVKIALEEAIQVTKRQSNKVTKKIFDDTLPGIKPPIGHLHPVTHAIEEISSIFEKIGFIRVRYPEVDWDWYAFESLNMPKTHPARDDWETFFVDLPENKKRGKVVLTPHTSNGQVREMERVKTPPIRMINIAKCYRRQSDVSHTVMFHQFEGLVVDEGINIIHLKGTIDYFVKQFFGKDRKSRLRPYHFQFTEPSFEVDVTCDICLGKGCKLCKEGWLELGGAGMVHPNVLKAGKINSAKYTGFAFGWGVERTYMMKSGVKIDDLRLLYSNDIRFLNQF